MAQAIDIPSPSVFLRKSPPLTDPPPEQERPPSRKNAPQAKRQNSATQAKKKAARKSLSGGAPDGGSGGDGVQKPKQSKSRNGCVTCKAKRLKCGEEKPGCQQCARRNVTCGGYRKDFKWRPFEETNVKVNIDKQNQQLVFPETSSFPTKSAESSKPTTPVPATTPPTSAGRDHANGDDGGNKKDSIVQEDKHMSAFRVPAKPAGKKGKQPATREGPRAPSPVRSGQASPQPLSAPDDKPSTSSAEDAAALDFLQPGQLSHLTPGLGLSPTLTEILLPFDQANPAHQDFMTYQLADSFQMSPVPNHTALNFDRMDEDDDSAMVTDDLPMVDLNHMALNSRHNSPISASLSPENAFHSDLNYIYPRPHYAPGSREHLTSYYDSKTCGILSIIDGPNENPWRTLIWPLAQQSPALYHALTAMTTYHAANDYPHLKVIGHEHKAHSLRYIREGIGQDSMTVHAAIATSLALGFSDSWDQHTITGNSHIKGAQANLRRAIEMHRRDRHEGVDLARLKFLCNAWVYMDVIARLTSVDSDESNDFDNAFLFSKVPHERANMVYGVNAASPGFGIDFGGMPVDNRLDPLMGCANTLFPLIGRVANLVRKVCRSQTNSPAIISQANDLKALLEDWESPNHVEAPQDPSTEVEHTLQTAEAYRWATLLHLHSAVPELPSLPAKDLAERVMQYLATVPRTSRTVVVQIYPLMVGGCEAQSAEDRQFVRDRWNMMHQRMGTGVIEKCATVTEEVWRRRDAYETMPASNRRLVPTAELHPSRVRGTPLARTPTGTFRDSDPGRTGVVFSYVEGNDDNNNHNDQRKNENPRGRERRNGRDPRMGNLQAAYTVRGHCHWVGVMWNWCWEILLA